MTTRSVPAGFEQRVFVLPSADDIEAITVAELGAGVEISSYLPEPINFSMTQNYYDTSAISERQDTNETGTITPDEGSFEIYRDREDDTAATALPDGADVVIVKFEGGGIAGDTPTTGDTYDAVRAKIGFKSDVTGTRAEGRRIAVPFSYQSAVARDKTIVAGGS